MFLPCPQNQLSEGLVSEEGFLFLFFFHELSIWDLASVGCAAVRLQERGAVVTALGMLFSRKREMSSLGPQRGAGVEGLWLFGEE